MAKRKSQVKSKHSELQYFDTLKPYMERVGKGNMNRHHAYSMCVKASACKCFEFNVASQVDSDSQPAFFRMASLRGICEDLIVLRFIKSLPSVDREELVRALMANETAVRVKFQDRFFSTIRPQQPVLRYKDVEKRISKYEGIARAIWNRHGWPNLSSGSMPQIRQIAENQSVPMLAVLYDYLYRLTSAAVHFNVQSLLRSGWGPSPKELTFSTSHFEAYFSNYCQLYGAFMFCLYFEFFGSVLRPGKVEAEAVAKIRASVLFTPRWPEMVTFEEMNVPTPSYDTSTNIFLSAMQAVSRRRLISKGVDYTNKRSRESRQAAAFFKQLASSKGILNEDSEKEKIVVP